MANQALFYPWIDIRDEQWLKASLLYWDEIRTIVPESIQSPYSSYSAQALEDSGILKPLRVNSEMEEVEGLSESVITYLSTDEGARMVASNGYRRSIIHEEKLPYKLDELVDIHPQKLPHVVRHKLRRFFRRSNCHVAGGFLHPGQ